MLYQPRISMRSRLHLPLLLALALLSGAPASAGPTATADHVVITEVVTLANTAPNRPLCSEYVEFHNPTAAAIDLSQYYLTDATFSTAGQYYWKITQADPSSATAGGGTFSDFHAKFPDGYAIAAGDTIVIAVGGSNAYQTAYGRLPDFELYEEAETPDHVPELVEGFAGSIGAGVLGGGTNTPALTENAESLVLYRWNGVSDLVQDVDFVRWGALAITSMLFDKTGVTVGGATYLADTAPAAQQTVSSAALVFGNAYARLSADEGAEATSGGNGLTGHNETSEDFPATWTTTAQSPPLAPSSWHPAAPIITAHDQTPATPVTGEAVTVSVTAVSPTAIMGVDFRYTVDGGGENVLAGATGGGGTWTAVIPVQPTGSVVRWYAVVTNAGGATGTYPVAAPRFASTFTVIAPPAPVIISIDRVPIVVNPSTPVTIEVVATSLSAITDVVVHYSVNGSAYATLAGTHQGSGLYTIAVPGQPLNAMVVWFVVVSNQSGLSVSSPADAPSTVYSWIVVEPEPKLLLSEVCTLGTDQEFIEIWNPGPSPVDMSDYYLTDAIYTLSNTGYWNLGGGGVTAETVGGGIFNDFTARFPDGFVIAAADTITVSVAGSARFANSYGFYPDLELYEDDAMPDNVPDMRSVFPEPVSSIVSELSYPALTNAGEVVVLFRWTPGRDLVVDVDVFVYGAGGSYQFSKAGRVVGSSVYASETAVGAQQIYSTLPTFSQSYTRLDPLEGTQILTGSNGIGGRDELSEPWTATWAIRTATPSRPSGGAAATPRGQDTPAAARLLPCYPNPFNPRTTLTYELPRAGHAHLAIFDLSGRLVRTLADEDLPAGTREVVWDGRDASGRESGSGTYLARLRFEGQSRTVRMGLLR